MSLQSRILLLSVLLVGGCDRARAESDSATEEEVEQKTPIVAQQVSRGSIEQALTAASTIEAEKMVTVHAESTGRLISFDLEEGDTLKKGASVGRIKYDSQAATLDRAKTSLEKAKRDLDIVERLHAQGHASDDELATARLAYETASLDVGDSKRNIRNTRVTAPFGGTVTERFVTKGAFVSAGAQLVTITDFDTLVARVYVPERELDRLAVGQPAFVQGKAARSRQGQGTIKRIAPVVDATTGTVKVTVGLPAELAGGDQGFLPGMYAEVRLTTERKDDVLLVSKRALVREDDDVFVFTVQPDDTAKRVKIDIGLEDAERAEVLSGLSEGQEVVVTGQAGLSDGGKVVLVDASGEPLDGSDGSEGQ
ncbi:MAG: efflux RND transporter periplasmic adaptor subunit [Nannocystaceae bacterium]|nr:efflux RND transporter periplasmic adaptor subunit [bacterium]